MSESPLCRMPDCSAPATHVLLTQTHTWRREAMRADQAPQIVRNRAIFIKDAAPVVHGHSAPYYCRTCAEERAS